MAAVSPITLFPAEIPAQINTLTEQIKQGKWENRNGALSDEIDHLISKLLTLNPSEKEESAKILSESCSPLEALRSCLPTTIRTSTLEAVQLMSQKKPLPSEQIARITQRLPGKTDADIRQSVSLFQRLKEILVNIWHALANWIGYNRIPLSKLELSSAELESVIPHLTYLHIDSECKIDEGTLQDLFSKAERLHTLKVETSSITTLPPLPANVKNLHCHSDSIKKLVAWPEGLQRCDISQCENLENLPQALPTSVESFDCSGDQNLEGLPDLNPNLKELRASHCPKFQSIPSLPASVTSADFSGCDKIIEITSLPPDLTELDVQDCPELRKVNLSDSQNLKLYARGASQLDLSAVPPHVTVIR